MIVNPSSNGVNSDCGQSPPFFPDIGVIALVPDEWGKFWESRHHILSRLARYFHIVWVNPATELRNVRFRWPNRNSANLHRGLTHSSFVVYKPGIWLPKLHRSHFLARFPERLRLGRAYSILHHQGCRKTILYLWRPEYEPALDLIQHDLSCYHIDDEYTFSKIEMPLHEDEARLIARVNSVFIHSAALMEKKGHLNPNTVFVPNGVDYHKYATSYAEPEDLRTIPRPRIGYVGKIKKHLDYALIETLAERQREWSFVFVGPRVNLRECETSVQRLAQMPNVYMLGSRLLDDLPAYTQHMDVCMLCYELDGYTKHIYPLKLHEYLASGRPVVGSPIRTLLDFATVVKLARTLGEWREAIQQSLTLDLPEQIEARRCVSRQYDWNLLIQRIAYSWCERLGPEYVRRLQQISSTMPESLPASLLSDSSVQL